MVVNVFDKLAEWHDFRNLSFCIRFLGGIDTVSYTHLDVYKRQAWGTATLLLPIRLGRLVSYMGPQAMYTAPYFFAHWRDFSSRSFPVSYTHLNSVKEVRLINVN